MVQHSLPVSIIGSVWKAIPGAWFDPKPGNRTLEGRVLNENPSLDDDDAFAAIRDPRFRMPQHYEKLIPYLPEGFTVVRAPEDEDAYAYAFGPLIEKTSFGYIVRDPFHRTLPYHEGAQVGDRIAYLNYDSARHFAVFTGDERVRSRWGRGSPVLEHPIRAVPESYWSGNDDDLHVIRRQPLVFPTKFARAMSHIRKAEREPYAPPL